MRLVREVQDLVRRRPWSFDVALAATLVVCAVVSVVVTDHLVEGSDQAFDRTTSLVASVAICGVLAVRRRWPLAVLGLVSAVYAVSLVDDANEGTFSAVAVYIAIYTAGAWGRRPQAHVARLVSVAVMAGLVAWSVADDRLGANVEGPDRQLYLLFVVLLNVFYFAAAWVMGDLAWSRRRRADLLEAQAGELAEAHAEIARRAVGAERMRIARELHDVVAHHVSVMGVQAGAARRVLDRSPERAAEALLAVETAGREAIGELHDLLGFLRQEGEVDGASPLPSLAHLDALVGQVTEADVVVDLTVDGLDGTVPVGLDLSAYRVVQEGLTNVVKHAGPGARATVAVRQRPDALEVDVVDDGGTGRRPASALADRGTGNGILGMRERVALHGGELVAGPRPEGGFALRATFTRRPEVAS